MLFNLRQATSGAGPIRGAGAGSLLSYVPSSRKWLAGANAPSDQQVPIWDNATQDWTFGVPSSTPFQVITQKSDLPAPAAGVITVPSGTYLIAASIDLGSDRIETATNSLVVFQGLQTPPTITSSTTSATITVTAGCTCTIQSMAVLNTAPSGDCVSVLTAGRLQLQYANIVCSTDNTQRAVRIAGTGTLFAIATSIVASLGVGIDHSGTGSVILYDCEVTGDGLNIQLTGAVTNFVLDTVDVLGDSGVVIAANVVRAYLNNVTAPNGTTGNALNFSGSGGTTEIVRVTNCDIRGYNNGIIMSAALPSLQCAVENTHLDVSTPFAGLLSAAAANTFIRGCTDAGGPLTETAITP